MATGTISWSSPIQGLDLPPIEIRREQPAISKIELRTESESRLTITCTLEDVFHERDAILVTRDAVELLVNRLAFEFPCQIGEPRCDGWSLPTNNKGDRYVAAREFIVCNDIAEATIRPRENGPSALITTLEQPTSLRDRYLRFYRFSAAQRDPITRFMFLYNLLLQIAGDKQRIVDSRILAIDPQVPVTPDPRNPGKSETLFTRLRNEIGHLRQNTNKITTAKEVEQNVGWFQDIVRKVILSV